MTRVDFYLLPSQTDRERWTFVCRLAEKTFKLGNKIYIYVETDEEAKQIDDLLWTFRDRAFIPHQRIVNSWDDEVAVHIGTNNPSSAIDLIINLNVTATPFTLNCDRIAEIVDERDMVKAAARDRYKFYKDNGCELTTHQVSG